MGVTETQAFFFCPHFLILVSGRSPQRMARLKTTVVFFLPILSDLGDPQGWSEQRIMVMGYRAVIRCG